MQTVTSETESKSLDLSICVHHYTLRAPCPKGQGTTAVLPKIPHSNCCKIVRNRPLRGRRGRFGTLLRGHRGRFGTLLQLLECGIFGRTAVDVEARQQTTRIALPTNESHTTPSLIFPNGCTFVRTHYGFPSMQQYLATGKTPLATLSGKDAPTPWTTGRDGSKMRAGWRGPGVDRRRNAVSSIVGTTSLHRRSRILPY